MSCTGSCNKYQGRGACDCVADVETEERDPDDLRSARGIALAVAAGIGAIAGTVAAALLLSHLYIN